MLAINALAEILPFNGKTTGQISDSIPTLFTPASFTFLIWLLIYFLLILFVIYQFKKPQETGYWFSLSCLANIAWIIAWHWEQIALSFVIILILLYSILMIYSKSKSSLYIKIPFSIYLGWVSVATVANFIALISSMKSGWPFFSEYIWTVIIIVLVILIAFLVLVKTKNPFYVFPIIWAFFGIIIKRINEPGPQGIIPIAFVGMIMLFLTTFLVWDRT